MWREKKECAENDECAQEIPAPTLQTIPGLAGFADRNLDARPAKKPKDRNEEIKHRGLAVVSELHRRIRCAVANDAFGWKPWHAVFRQRDFSR